MDYVLAIAVCVYSLLQLWKDWEKHQTKVRKAAVLFLVLSVAILSAITTSRSKARAAKQHADDQKQIAELKKAVEVADGNQKVNTQEFVRGFDAISMRVADLQTQVKTQDLQTKLASVQADLQKTQKALAPGPKAELTFTFVPFEYPTATKKLIPVTEATLPMKSDGVVHIEFAVINLTEVDASDVDLGFGICDDCKYAKEPERLQKDPAFPNVRIVNIPHLHPREASETYRMDVIPPPTGQEFVIGMSYRCTDCIVPKHLSKAIVKVSTVPFR